MEARAARTRPRGRESIRGELVETGGRKARNISNFRCWPNTRHHICAVLPIAAPEVRHLLGYVRAGRVEEEVRSLRGGTGKAKEARGRHHRIRPTRPNADRT